MKEHILIVGSGHMGGALLEGCLQGGHEVLVLETNARTLESYKERGISCYPDVDSLRKAQPAVTMTITMIVYAVKPQVSREVVSACKFLSSEVVHVSIMAGVAIGTLENLLDNPKAMVVRSMPNLPLKIGKGAIVSVGNRQTCRSIKSRIDDVFSHLGLHLWLEDESLLHAVTAISGSGPAYLLQYMEEMVRAGIVLGLSQNLALKLVVQTFSGAITMAEMEVKRGISLTEQKMNIASKGGTTEAALEVLQDDVNGLPSVLARATKAAKQRSVALGDEKK